MKNNDDFPTDSKQLSAEINFLKMEINFLLKLLNKSYIKLLNHDKVVLLDSYWVKFEKNMEKLDVLFKEVNKKDANELVELYQLDHIYPAKIQFKDEHVLISNFFLINKEVKILKKNFYEFMAYEISAI